MTILKKILLFLVLISLSATGIMYLIEPFENLDESIVVLNNKLVCDSDIKELIRNKFDDGNKFIYYNPLKFAELVKENPLVKEALVRTTIFPEKKFTVIVNEEKLWAVYRNQLLNEDFKKLKEYDNEANVLQISSNINLEKDSLKIMKELVHDTNKRLTMINLNEINSIEVIDHDISLISEDFKIIFGKSNSKYKKKIDKLDHLISTLQEKHYEISYIDLSLDTDEAIIGKRI